MKPHLLYRDRDFDVQRPLSAHADALIADLELDILFNAMARGDAFLLEVAQHAVMASLDDPDAIVYRQDILRDCLVHQDLVLEIYRLAIECLQEERRSSWWRTGSPESVLNGAVSSMEILVPALRALRRITDEHAAGFGSEGFTTLFQMLSDELSDAYFDEIDEHLGLLRFRSGVLISARLGKGNKGIDYVLRRPPGVKQTWLQRLGLRARDPYSFQIADRDDAGFKALGELRARGVNLVANALAQSAAHIESFLRMLLTELAFYLGCTNLWALLTQKGEPVAFATPVTRDRLCLSADGLYDACLSLIVDDRVVGNSVRADGKSLVMVTGANQGGKSTFLRSVGLAQLMMQCGMFVPADSLTANICTGVFTHYKREEDATMKCGKFEEELARMSEIADLITPGSLMLFNESFAATNEREGSEIARQVIRALREAEVKVVYVTHLYDLARSLFYPPADDALSLRAERESDGRRTFRVVEGEPLPTSHGEDVFRRIFAVADVAVTSTAAAGPSG